MSKKFIYVLSAFLMYFIIQSTSTVAVPTIICIAQNCDVITNRYITRSAIAEVDDRYGIVDYGAQLGLSPGEIQWLSSITGDIWCESRVSTKNNHATATLYGQRDQIITVAHAFYSDNAKDYNLERCFFSHEQRHQQSGDC